MMSLPINLHVDDILLAPGEPTPITVQIENLGDDPIDLTLRLWGVESNWCHFPTEPVTVAGASMVEVTLIITVPRSYPASTLPVTLSATPAVVGASSTTANVTIAQHASFIITIGDARTLSARLDPPEIDGRHIGIASVIIRNRGSEPERYVLAGKTAGQRLSIQFDDPTPVVPPGQESAIKATIRTKRRLTGAIQRHPFAVVAQGRSHPVELTGAFSSHPTLGTKTAKIAALLAVLLVWGALASIGITAFDAGLHRKAVAAQTIPSPTAQPVKTKTSNVSKPSTTSTPSTAKTSSPSSTTSTNSSSVSLTGTVKGASPGGVQVSATPVAATAPAMAANQSGSTSSTDGMIYANTTTASFNAAAPSDLGPTMSTYTAPDGAFVLNGLKPGVSYLVTFSKPGFTTHKVLLSPANKGQQIQLNASLVPGTGSLSGTAYGPSGPLGDALVSVSNGLLNFTTHTASVGSGVGSWSISQISTPGTYLIQVSATGYGTQVQTVTLGPSGSQSNIATHLSANVGSITGVISSATTNAPLGGAQVTATNGQQTYSATTFTVGKVGAYDLPNLAIPGHWTVTIGAPGYQTQTEAVDLTGNTTVNTVLSQSGGNLTGTIGLPSNAGKNTTNTIGLTLTAGSTVYKTLSTSRTASSTTVAYQFPQVSPGVYTLTAEGYGFTTVSTNVTLTAGTTTTANLTLALASSTALDNATITGTVTGVGGQTLPSVPIELDGNQVTTTNASGAYSIQNVAPGVATITAIGTDITTNNPNGYTTGSQQVDVGSGATVTAPTIALDALASVTGQLLDSSLNEPIGQVQVPGCTPNSTASVSLTQGGKVINTNSVPSTDVYSFDKVTPGSYVLKASAPCFEPTQVAIDIANGQSLTQQIDLSTTPTYSITVEQFVTSSGVATPAPVLRACVTLSSKTPGASGSSSATDANGIATFANLSVGAVYSVIIDQYAGTNISCTSPGSSTPIATQKTSFTAEPNGTQATVFVAPTFTSLAVTLQFPYVDYSSNNGSFVDCRFAASSSSVSVSAACPSLSDLTSSTSVSLNAIDGYQSSQAQTTTITGQPTKATDGSYSWRFPAIDFVHVLSGSASLTVTAPGFETFSQTISLPTTGQSSTINELLTPTPEQVTIHAPSSLSLSVTPNALVPTSYNTLHQSTTIAINAINASNDTYRWTDDPATGHPSGYAEPGIYQVTGTGSGIWLVPETVTIPVCTSSSLCQTTLNLTQTSLTITPTDLPSSSTAKATLLCVQSSTSTTTLAADVGFVGGSAEFYGLGSGSSNVTPACSGKGDSLEYQITLDNVLTYRSSLFSLTTTDVTRTPTLTYIEGTLSGEPYSKGPTSPLANVTVYICDNSTTSCTNSNDLAAGTTDTVGGFIAPAALSQGSPDLTTSTSYAVGTSASAYQQPTTTTVSACSSSSCTPTPITLIANPVVQQITVSTGTSAVNVTITPTTTSSGATATGTTTSESTCASSSSGTTGSCSATFTLTLAPTQWTFQVSATGYSSAILGPITYEPGDNPGPLSVTLTQENSTVSGTVTVAPDANSQSSTPIANLELTLSSTSSASFTPETAKTDSNGAYIFQTPVPTGTYSISVPSSSGYLEQSSVSFTITSSNPTVENFSVYAASESLNVYLSSPPDVSTGDLAGAAVTLTPTTSSGTPVCPQGSDPLLGYPSTAEQSGTATAASSGSPGPYANFASLTPDVYSIAVTGADIPTQPSPLPTVTLCPGETSASTNVTVNQGDVTGTVTDTSLAANTSVTVTITATPTTASSSAPTLTTPCTLSSTASSASCSYTLKYLAYNTSYAITPKATGYTFSPSPSSQSTSFTPSSTTPTYPLNFTASAS